MSPQDIIQDNEGNLEIMGQWFYRPEEATDKGGGCWKGLDTRELFYSFHRDVVSAESIMHKCVVHFVPLNKQFPLRKEHPGFIVQRVYDTVERKLWKLTDKDYEDSKQHEIDLLVQKTRERIGELPDVVPEDTCADQEGQVKGKQRSNLSPLNVTREDDRVRRTELDITAGTPGSCTSGASEYYKVLANFNALTKDDIRDKWMEKLLQGLHSVCDDKNIQLDGKDKDESNRSDGDKFRERGGPKDGGATSWPDAAVAAVVALEKASHDLFISEFKKYNNKMRQLYFNLKSGGPLARRLVNNKLEAVVVVNMAPNELREGLTANEIEKNEPEASEHMQMTDKRCSGCGEKKVVVTDVIQGREDRYKLECTACGSSWYASRDEISTLTIEDTSRAIGNVGTAPLATAKFEDVEKKLVSPKESEKPDADIFQKTTKSQMPVLETQKSFLKRPKPE
ncbi:hypothetical protein GIB67_008338 [Kingdonia uniflora]|uniref:Uncharacterized protein n=1 Tax=Kingdonia uniflora TaxID=39325 RepID=A0A7J7N4U1_9MAGN|nr:hypothetical protein GIB67_008338 [Kingdonia uniflora]